LELRKDIRQQRPNHRVLVRTACLGLLAASLVCLPTLRGQSSQTPLTQEAPLRSVKAKQADYSLPVLRGFPATVGSASTPANLPPVVTLDLSSLLPPGHAELSWTTIAFVSETSIAVGLCSEDKTIQCSLSLVRWEGGVLRPFAQTAMFSKGNSIHPASEGRVLTTSYCCRPVLYSSDLSKSLRLPSSIFAVSPSGSTVAATTKGAGKSSVFHANWNSFEMVLGVCVPSRMKLL